LSDVKSSPRRVEIIMEKILLLLVDLVAKWLIVDTIAVAVIIVVVLT
jgi:hypothetical protein